MQIRLILAFQLFAVSAFASVDQVARWNAAQVRTVDVLRADKAVFLFQRTRARYEAIEKMRVNGMPAAIIFAIHGRESSWDFKCHLHEGSTLLHRTRDIPKNRPPPPAMPPFTWEDSANDALYVLKHEDRVNWSLLQDKLDAIEAYNGTGYLRYHPSVPSPYLFAGCSIYKRGKYTSDGKFDGTAVDKQLGVVTILKQLEARGVR